MKTVKHIMATAGIVTLLFSAAFAGDSTKTATGEKPKELKPQTICPVMGGPIDSSLYTDIQGQRVYHCCPMCSAKLKADPDKYFKKAAAQGVLFENIQTTCPVSGEKLEDKTVYTDYEGRRIYFCCKKCRGQFKSDPQTFLKKMDAPKEPKTDSTAVMPDMPMHHDKSHEDHQH
jgi:YHS domain-containing protein